MAALETDSVSIWSAFAPRTSLEVIAPRESALTIALAMDSAVMESATALVSLLDRTAALRSAASIADMESVRTESAAANPAGLELSVTPRFAPPNAAFTELASPMPRACAPRDGKAKTAQPRSVMLALTGSAVMEFAFARMALVVRPAPSAFAA